MLEFKEGGNIDTTNKFYEGLYSHDQLYEKIPANGGFMSLYKNTQNYFR